MAPTYGSMCYPVQSAIEQNRREMKPMDSSPPYSYSMGDVSACPSPYSSQGMSPYTSPDNFEVVRTQEEISLEPKYPWSNRKNDNKKLIRMNETYNNLANNYNGMDWYPPAMSYSCPCGPFSQFGPFSPCKQLNPFGPGGPCSPCGPYNNFCMPYGPCGPFDPYSPCGPYRSPSSPCFPTGPAANSCTPFGLCRPYQSSCAPCGPLCNPIYGGYDPRPSNAFMGRIPCSPYGDAYDDYYQAFASPSPIQAPPTPTARGPISTLPTSSPNTNSNSPSYTQMSTSGLSAGGQMSTGFIEKETPKYEETVYRVNVDLNA